MPIGKVHRDVCQSPTGSVENVAFKLEEPPFSPQSAAGQERKFVEKVFAIRRICGL